MPRPALVLSLVALTLLVAGAAVRAGNAVLIDQAAVTNNSFTTAASFATATPTPTPTPTPSNTGFLSCAANSAVTTNSGDNDGFQLDPGNACANDASFAEDTDSGTDTGTSCGGSDKDRHLYYDYGFSIPSGSTIAGIEVRLDAWANGAGGDPFICVELSWDGGTTWTTDQATSTLSTSEQTFTLGAATDTWGRTWSDADFSNTNFRVRITDVASAIQRDFRLDWAAVQVTYTGP